MLYKLISASSLSKDWLTFKLDLTSAFLRILPTLLLADARSSDSESNKISSALVAATANEPDLIEPLQARFAKSSARFLHSAAC